ncbi:MAG: caspase family protein [Actinomycetota bacterium]
MDRVNSRRRHLLKGGLAAASLFLPLPSARVWAQSEGAVKLLRAPKVALVLGNGSYKGIGGLRNPVNDANAIAEVLKDFGFDVTMKLDAGRVEMESAIDAYALGLKQRKAVGLFYYAGHGLQLSWTNFLVPVDAAIRRAEDVQAGCVDLSRLINGVREAANPMNVIILDACRENPFERDFRVSNKGLTQMDAPNDTLLAYATAPGNTASDGRGAHGLYTETLLKELLTPETRIEDVFKRVRLNVRRTTGGAQVPWESTSLEEDFWFMPPGHLVQIADARVREERERAASERKFNEELAHWESIKDSRNAADLYAFLLESPSGYIAEQAQFRLDQLEKPRVQVQPGANGLRPLASGTNRYVLGDAFTYERNDRLKNVTTRIVRRVTYADNDRVEFNGGGFVTDQMGSILRNGSGTKNPGFLVVPNDIAVGKRWRTAFTNTNSSGVEATNYWDFRVEALEQIRVPAGAFPAFKVVGSGESRGPKGQTLLSQSYWVDPTTMQKIRGEEKHHYMSGRRVTKTADISVELVGMVLAPR